VAQVERLPRVRVMDRGQAVRKSGLFDLQIAKWLQLATGRLGD